MDVLDGLFSEVNPLVNPRQIESLAAEIAEIEKPTDFDSFQNCVRFLEHRFSALGMQCTPLRFPADGITKYHTFTAPIGFRTRKAYCAIVAPESRLKVLGDRDQEPNTAIVGTGHTGSDGIIAGVVEIKELDDFTRTNIEGKIVYCADLHPQTVRSKIIEGGGIALVSSYTKNRTDDFEYVRWVNTWDSQSDGWLPTKKAADENLPGISISPAMGEYLEKCLREEDVRLRLITEGEYFSAELPNVNAYAAGERNQEIFLTGHLFEQGFVDNASGVAVAFSVADIMSKLKKNSGGKHFIRGFRNFHGQECYDVLALQKYQPELLRNVIAQLNIDSVGQMGGVLTNKRGLLASYNFTPFLMELVLRKAQSLAGEYSKNENSFEINCTLLADPMVGGISTCSFAQDNDGWHTSKDRYGVKRLDPQILHFTTLCATVWLYFLVRAETREAEWLLGEYYSDVSKSLIEETVADTELYLKLKHREMESLQLLADAEDRLDFQAKLKEVADRIDSLRFSEKLIEPIGNAGEIEKSKKLFPVSLVGGPAVDEYFSEEQLAIIGKPKWDVDQLVLRSWADGKKSIYDITRWAIFENGIETMNKLTLGYALSFFEIYAKAGLVKL